MQQPELQLEKILGFRTWPELQLPVPELVIVTVLENLENAQVLQPVCGLVVVDLAVLLALKNVEFAVAALAVLLA